LNNNWGLSTPINLAHTRGLVLPGGSTDGEGKPLKVQYLFSEEITDGIKSSKDRAGKLDNS